MIQNILHSRDLIWQLFKRDFISGYKQSFLGIFWIFIQPLAGILAWVFMNATGILNPGTLYSGLCPTWKQPLGALHELLRLRTVWLRAAH